MLSVRAHLVLAAVLMPLAGSVPAQPAHEGYYYPSVGSEETFERVLKDSGDPGRERRIDFVVTLTAAQIASPDTPPYAFVVKGSEAEKLILIGLDDEIFRTLFRARAVLAQMTAKVRGGGFFADSDLKYEATFLDMLQTLGFDTLVLTDGDTWSHRVNFIRE